jgi:hypothetical protein
MQIGEKADFATKRDDQNFHYNCKFLTDLFSFFRLYVCHKAILIGIKDAV